MPGWLSWTPHADEDLPAILKRLGIRHYDEDLLAMPIARLRQEFGYKTSSGIKLVPFFRNVIWQFHELILAGSPPNFYYKRGFIRGMWYHIKTRISRYKPLRGDHSSKMGEVLADLVRAGLFSYKDFNFRDRDQALRRLGTENRHIIVFAEKDGFISLTEAIAETYGCTAITLGGLPSFLTSSYMVAEMADAGFPMAETFYCFSIVDFDPAGDNAAEEFIKQLAASGLRNFHQFEQYGARYPRLDLTQPANLTGGEINAHRYDLKAKVQRQKQTIAWAARTGGVDGKGSRRYGIEADEFTEARIHEMVAAAITPYLKTNPEVIRRRVTMRKLADAVEDFMVEKILHPDPPPPRIARV